MVYLKDLASQYPWNPEETATVKTEIYTHMIESEDESQQWIVPIVEPMNGFAYTGFRIHVVNKDNSYSMNCRLVLSDRHKPMFGSRYDHFKAVIEQWTPLSFPLTHKMVAIHEDGLSLIIEHNEPVHGHVEFVGHQCDDILEDESEISYAFLHPLNDSIEYILTQNNYMIKPNMYHGAFYQYPIKVLPSISRLLTKDRNPWEDTEVYWNKLQYTAPLLRI